MKRIAKPWHAWVVRFLTLLIVSEKANREFIAAQENGIPAVPAQKEASETFDRARQLESFDRVWQTIKDIHWDPNLVGDKWDRVRTELRPKAELATNAAEVQRILEEMLSGLGQSHCAIIPAAAYRALEEQSKRGGAGISGLTIRWIDDELVVTQVRPGSPANLAGIECGWALQSLTRLTEDRTSNEATGGNSLTSQTLIDRVRVASVHSVTRLETAIGLAGTSLMTGTIGHRLRLEFLDHAGQSRQVEIELVKGEGIPAKLGHLPVTNVEFQSRTLPDEIGYISFNAFLDPVRLIGEFQKALNDDYAQSKGLVIDLRGNMGGLILLTQGMSGWFVDDSSTLGRMTMKNAPLNIQINPRSPRYRPPVAVLIDECSISAAEIYAAGLFDLGAARLFGQRSAGLVLPSNVSQLPNGDGFQYVLADYESASGRVLEGHGVEPNETIPLTRELIRRDPDPVLTAATRWIVRHSK